MKKWLVLSVFMAALPLTMMAQDDDLYFNPKQEAKKAAEERVQKAKLLAAQRARQDSIYALYWSGSDRNVDEYNRGGKLLSHYQNIGADSLGNDIISFRVGKGVAPDSIYDDEAFAEKYMRGMGDDFDCTRDLSRWDGFYDPWFYSYYGCGPYYWRSSYWRWHNPWRYGYYAGWYDPWFDPWFDPGIMAMQAGMVVPGMDGVVIILGIGEVRLWLTCAQAMAIVALAIQHQALT